MAWDAPDTQKDTARAATAKKGDYAGALKGSRQSFYEDAAPYFDERTLKTPEGGAQTYIKTTGKEQSGAAVRECCLTRDIGRLSQKKVVGERRCIKETVVIKW